MPITPGDRLGPYEILSALGAGGMGEVWRARDTRLGREVALKVLPDAFAADQERISRFRREAQLLAALSHPNIAAIHSFEIVDGVQLLVMEMVPGETVRELLSAGPLGLTRALGIARQVADALDAAHGKGILHRDLKPPNVKVTPEGKVKLLDFGLAKAFAPAPTSSDISESPTLDAEATRRGMVLGTASYMSPEQARGQPLDWRSDVWSFGCLLYEMLAGTKAFPGDSTSDILVAILDREPDATALPPETPRALLELLKGCLTKSRDERTPNLAHARQTIDAILERRASTTPRSGLSVSARIRRAPRAWAGAGALLAVAVAGMLYVALRGKDMKALPATKLLAVLPATDYTGRSDGRLFCDGVSAGLRVKLQQLQGLQVMLPSGPETSRDTDAAKWARDTGANLIVQPMVRQSGSEMKISFSVALATSPVQIASGEVTGPASAPFRLEDELAAKLVTVLEIRMAGGTAATTPGSRHLAPGAPQNDYLVALGCLERYDDKESVQKAIDLLTAIPDGGSSAPVQAALGRAYLASYDLSKDVAMADLARKAADHAVSLDASVPEVQVTMGRILTATGEPAKAAGVLQEALKGRPDDAEAVRALAIALTRAGRLAEAETVFQRLVELRPRGWNAWSGLGYFYFNTLQYQKAIDAYQKGIALNPEVARLHYNLGAAFMRLRRYTEAEKAFRRSNEIAPQPIASSNLGTLYYIQGRYQDAADAFTGAVRLSPLDYWNHKALADALLRLPGGADRARAEYGEASRLAREALRVDPKSGEAHAVIGTAAWKTGNPRAGLDEIRQALALAPDDPLVLQCAAIVLANAGRTADALDAIERGLLQGLSVDEIETEPDFSPLRSDARYRAILEKHWDGKEKP